MNQIVKNAKNAIAKNQPNCTSMDPGDFILMASTHIQKNIPIGITL